jgi:ArsR family metal-binding transcriptional regulator
MGGVMDIFVYTIYAQYKNIAARCAEIAEEKGIKEAEEASEIANFLAERIKEANDVNVISLPGNEEKAERLIELLKVLPKPIL